MIVDNRKAQSAELWVHQNGEQAIHATNPRFHVVRNGEMRIIRKSDGSIFRYTQDLNQAGILDDDAVMSIRDSEDYDVVDTPWFEVVDVAEPTDEGAVCDTFDEAVARADEMYRTACRCEQDDDLPFTHDDGCPVWELNKEEWDRG
jgi:hypothetical protein